MLIVYGFLFVSSVMLLILITNGNESENGSLPFRKLKKKLIFIIQSYRKSDHESSYNFTHLKEKIWRNIMWQVSKMWCIKALKGNKILSSF